ncbi:MAG: bifunctional diaminohydroxyphosphoribosylaminopyrimidine deaminase/5-amino-6-(5-phosphoribosylamino)uracil reductase RibD [Planctomycetota bacterium]
MSTDAYWMRRALVLAARSLGGTWPNPGVGCVIVASDRLIGAGRHEYCGGPHAEVNALASCRCDPRGATAYVSLAPCTRYGRTPPCCDALIRAGVTRVVAALADPHQDDAGERLAAAGIPYEVGCCREQAARLHGGWLQRMHLGRPRITGKWAMTLDGCLACASGDSSPVSSAEARHFSRRRRERYDAILIGAGTARADNPQLLSLRPAARTPLRIVVGDPDTADLRPGRCLFDSARRHPLLLVHGPQVRAGRLQELQTAGVQLLCIDDPHDPQQVCQALGRHGLNEVLVEGGAQLHGAWLRAGLVDRVECYVGSQTLGGGLPVAQGPGCMSMAETSRYQVETRPRLLGSTCFWSLTSHRAT